MWGQGLRRSGVTEVPNYLFYRQDGAIDALVHCDEELDFSGFNPTIPYEQFWIKLDDELASSLSGKLEEHIVENPLDAVNARVRKRNIEEMETRVREIYNRVKSGELHRVPNDLINKYKHFFTLGELEEVELPEQRIRRLEARLKALETRLR